MELKKKYIHMNCEKGRAFSQITLDDDYNLPDYKPDIIKIMRQKGEIHFDDIKVSENHLTVRGNLEFLILYRSDQENKKLDCLSGSIPFTENISMNGISEYDPVQMSADMEDLTVGIINSRKLSVRALVMLQARVRTTQEETVITDVETEDPLEIQKEYQEVLQLIECKRDSLRFKQELALASSKPNIRDILWKSVQLRGVESRLREGSVEVSGEILVYILYLGEEDTEHLQWIETTVPLKGSADCSNCEEGMIYQIKVSPRSTELNVKPDYDGEQRMIGLELLLDLDICLWQEENMEIVRDLYSLSQRIIPEYEKGHLPRLVAKNYAKSKVSDRIQLDMAQENILQICSCEGRVSIDHTEVETDGIRVEGSLAVELMYITTDDAMPVGNLEGLLAFEQFIEVPKITADHEIALEAKIGQLSAMLADNTQVEIKAVIDLNLMAFDNQEIEKLCSVGQEETDINELQRQPGIVGYIVKGNESLWQIAKENHTTVTDLVLTNHLTGEEVQRGDKLLIVKTV